MTLLSLENLKTSFHTRNGVVNAVDDVSFTVDAGEVLGIVGESGSGKSVTCYSMLGLIPSPPGKVENGKALFKGKDLLTASESELRKIRGSQISMIFQDPMTSLNPYMRIGDQIIEPLVYHQGMNKKEALKKAISALKEVGIKDADERINSYPHEFSGGMRQRVMIAMALVTEPELLIADEPTTALDVTIQAQILDLLKDLQKKHNLAIIFITHDLGVVAHISDKIAVMKKGKLVEQGSSQDIIENHTHPYTKKLFNAIPRTAKPEPQKFDGKDSLLLEVKNLKTSFPIFGGTFFKRVTHRLNVVKEISLNINRGEILGLVGESGSGKSTLGRSIMRLIESESGQVFLDGEDLYTYSDSKLKSARRDVQMIFQDPYASLNPRMTVFDTIAEPLKTHDIVGNDDLVSMVNSLMDDVGLDRSFVRKYPHEFSGGQRQRIAIARAIALKPKLMIADEPVSALDVTIQAQVLELLMQLAKKYKLTMLFISHDLAVVRYISDRVIVMQSGTIVEENDTETLYSDPQHPYTQKLLSANLSL